MNIQLIKILRYSLKPTHDQMSNFQFVCKVLDQSIDPPSAETSSLVIKNQIVMCSPLLRARQCIMLSLGQKISHLHELKEIPFNIVSTCSAREYFKYGSSAVRQQFKQAFIQDQLMISRKEILQQAKRIFTMCSRYESVTIVSHTFRLTLLKAIYETQGKIISNPELIHNYISDKDRIMDFGEIFYL